MILEIDGISVHITRKAVKNLTLRVYPPDGTVKVSAPLMMKKQTIYDFINQKKKWINTQRDRVINQYQQSIESYKTGSTIDYLGKKYLIIIQEYHGPLHIQIKDELIYCHVKPQSSEEQVGVLLNQWYRAQMYSLLPPLIRKWESIIGVRVAQWGVKKMKTRWGSCNTRDRRIWLNLVLIKKPALCIEYVLVHELIHLLEASHNQRFYFLMSQFMPKWKEYESILQGLDLHE